ncbi:hypothetical protein [Paraburkholderia phytofirmans]|uniref:hypothetical protein n=1 Tax=Paraburkholderia phytofirmans TaxID=261302 RepID=UPI0038B7FA5B
MSDTNAALIAFLGVLAGGYVNNFLGEDFRRFRDGQALAGALAGELNSHATAIPLLRHFIGEMVDALRSPEGKVTLGEFDAPNSPVFDAGVAKLGVLGPALAQEVTFVYEQIRAFRITFERLSRQHKSMSNDQFAHSLEFCLMLINTAYERGTKLIADLQSYAKDGYWITRPWLSWLRTIG